MNIAGHVVSLVAKPIAKYGCLICLLACAAAVPAFAQTSAAPAPADQRTPELERKIDAISAAMAVTQHQIEQSQQQIEQSQRQMQQLQQQLLELRQEIAPTAAATSATPTASIATSSAAPNPDENSTPTDERLQTLEAAVKLHDQSKVESSSKYPVRLTGLILFNGYLNKGVPDNTDLPAIALPHTYTSGTGSLGGSLRQTILGLEGDGPRLAGARTSANINFDFFSGISYTGYGPSAGVVRMRTASVDFDWPNDSVEVGVQPPLISPLSPASFATVAEPSLAGAGNLWTWAPQLRYTHRLPLHNQDRLQFEFGLWDSPSAGYNANQQFRSASPAELAEQPAYETRLSYAAAGDHPLQIGVSGYYSRQSYPGYQGYSGNAHLDSWAAATDWRLPFAHHFELSGEGYRGRSLGGLGGGLYKDAVVGTNPVTGANVLRGLNAIGGWTEFKTRFTSSLETNLSFGLDDGFASDFHAVTLPATASALQLRARNRMLVANLIFRPKTYIILSPEYRRIWTSPISGASSTLNIFTLSAGYQF